MAGLTEEARKAEVAALTRELAHTEQRASGAEGDKKENLDRRVGEIRAQLQRFASKGGRPSKRAEQRSGAETR